MRLSFGIERRAKQIHRFAFLGFLAVGAFFSGRERVNANDPFIHYKRTGRFRSNGSSMAT
jgi:hypothetical protein